MPMAPVLMQSLYQAWLVVNPGGSADQFYGWLEQVDVATDEQRPAEMYVDSLDAFLIASIQEIEETLGRELAPADLENELLRVWRHTYAFASATNEEALRGIWLWRACDQTALSGSRPAPPDLQNEPFTILSAILDRRNRPYPRNVAARRVYASNPPEEKFAFVCNVLSLLSDIRPFAMSTKLGRAKSFRDWRKVLRWWLVKSTLPTQPTSEQITVWYDFVASNFIYRGVWGVGSALGLLLD
jgi:hypothetical protein